MEHPDVTVWWKHRRQGFHIGLMWSIIQTLIWILIYKYNPVILSVADTVVKCSYAISLTLIVMYYLDTAVGEFKTDASMRHPDPKVWWKNRRMGFYVGIWWGILQTFVWVMLVQQHSNEMFENLFTVIASSYTVSSILIMSYYGNTVAEQYATKLQTNVK